MNQRACHARRFASRWPSRANVRLRAWHAACGEREHASRQALRLIPRATVISNVDGGCTRDEDPALSCLLRRRRAAVTPTPPMVSLLRPRFTCPRRPPGLPLHEPCRTSSARLMLKAPTLTRLQDGTCTAPTLGAGWCRVTPTSRRSTVSSTARPL